MRNKMPLISDGTGTYTIKPDGTKEYGCTTSFKINGKKVFDFDQETGILKISISPNNLEVLISKIGEIPAEGMDINLPTSFGEIGRFKGVKKLESIPEKPYILGTPK